MKIIILSTLILFTLATCGAPEKPPLPSLTDSVDQAIKNLPAPATFPVSIDSEVEALCQKAFCGMQHIETGARRQLTDKWPDCASPLAKMVIDQETPPAIKGRIMTFVGEQEGAMVSRFCRYSLEARPEQAIIVRRLAVLILGQKGSLDDVPTLVLRLKYETLNTDADPTALTWTARALAQWQNLAGIKPLMQLLDFPESREAAGTCLVEILGLEGITWPANGSWEDLRQQCKRLQSTWEKTGRSTRDKSKTINPELKRRLLIRLGRSREFNLRSSDDSKFIFARCGWTGCEPISLGLRDKNRSIRKLSLECASELGQVGQNLAPWIAPLLRDRILAPFAIEALGRNRAIEAALYLVVLTNGNIPDYRQAALLALGRMGAAQGLPCMEKALADPERTPEEHMAAALSIGLLGQENRAGKLLRAMRSNINVHQPTLTRYLEELASHQEGAGK